MYGPDVRILFQLAVTTNCSIALETNFGKGKYFSAKRSTGLKVQRRGNVTGEQKVGN